MVQYLNEAELHSGWARGRIDDPMAGAAQVRRVLAAFVDQGVKVNLGVYTGLLAQLEAETLGADSALARHRRSLRASRSKSSIVARSPSCIASAAKSFSSATPPMPVPPRKHFGPQSRLRRSKARAARFCWRRSALAKLYQSTGRPARGARCSRARTRRLFADAGNARRSPRRRRCWRRCRRRKRSNPPSRRANVGCIFKQLMAKR